MKRCKPKVFIIIKVLCDLHKLSIFKDLKANVQFVKHFEAIKKC